LITTHCFFSLRSGLEATYSKRVIDVETFSFAETRSPDRKRFIVRADEKLTAFLELEAAIRAGSAGGRRLIRQPDFTVLCSWRRLGKSPSSNSQPSRCGLLEKTVLTLPAPGGQGRTRAKFVGCLPQEFHLTLFPQG